MIEEGLIPEDVAIQVLVQCRPELIERTFEAIAGARQAIVHFYNSTSTLQRRVVFGLDRAGSWTSPPAPPGWCSKSRRPCPTRRSRYEYSPESFTGTELDFAVEICDAVMDVIEPTPDRRIIINLPATVEMYAQRLRRHDRMVRPAHPDAGIDRLSVHPHNDRGTAVAAAELALLAGADRVEGTLFGNGERTGNVDVVTLALNLFTQGVDPGLDLHDIDHLRRWPSTATACRSTRATPMPATWCTPPSPVATRTPSRRAWRPARRLRHLGSALPAHRSQHVGRTYEAIIRINSQSGKGGVAYVMDAEHGLDLPRALQIEFSKQVQAVTEASGTEIKPGELWDVFARTYLPDEAGIRLICGEVSTREKGTTRTAQILVDGRAPDAVRPGERPGGRPRQRDSGRAGVEVAVQDYHEHALTAGSEASAVAYVQATDAGGNRTWGVGISSSILDASLQAVISAANRLRGVGWPAMSIQPAEDQPPPRGHVRVVYLGPVAPHWRVDSDFGDRIRHRGVPATGPGPAAPVAAPRPAVPS